MSDLLYAWGNSSLGNFFAVRSDRGLVAFEFAEPVSSVVPNLQERFPNVRLIEDPQDMAANLTALAHLVDHPDEEPSIPLDMRGTDFERRVWDHVRMIPAGTTTTYGAIARIMGMPDGARAVATANAANRLAILIPCHRVVRKDGALSSYRWGLKRKRELLFRECHLIASRHMA